MSNKSSEDEVILAPQKVLHTGEDVTMAYLRGELDEAKFRDGVAMYGVTPGFFGKADNPNRIDAGFSVKVPDEFFEEPAVSPTTEEQIKLVEKEAEARNKATEASDKVLKESDAGSIAEKQNAAAKEAYDSVAVEKEKAAVAASPKVEHSK